MGTIFGLLLAAIYAIVLAIQFIRGFIYVGSLTPLLVSLRANLKELIIVMTGFLYIPGDLRHR